MKKIREIISKSFDKKRYLKICKTNKYNSALNKFYKDENKTLFSNNFVIQHLIHKKEYL